MASESRPSTSNKSGYASYLSSGSPHPGANTRPKGRRKAATSTITGDQQIICAITESRGVSPVVGLAFVNLYTAEASLCQISDTQTYERTLQKLHVYDPTEVLIANTATNPASRLFSLLGTQIDARVTPLERKYWAENAGIEYIQQLAFEEEVEAIKVCVGGNYYAICCLAAVLKYVEIWLLVSFSFHSLRIKYEPSEGSMMMDLSTIRTLELIQNSHSPRSKHSLFGLLNHTLTPMGARKLKSNILQPSTDRDLLERRYEAVGELSTMEDMFFGTRHALKGFVDADRVLTAITIVPSKPSIHHSQQCINNVIMLKQYIKSINPIYEALATAKSELLKGIAMQCHPDQIADVQKIIDETINEDIIYQSRPLDLRNQRTYAVKAGVNGLLDVARQTYKEANSDAFQLITEIGSEHNLNVDLKYDPARQYFIRISSSELVDRDLPSVFINVFHRRNIVECQTLDLVKLNQKITDSHHEVIQMSDQSIQDLIDGIRMDVAPLIKISEAIAVLDMLASFAQLITTQKYCRPELTDALAIKSGRHPVRERVDEERYIPNDVYATQQSRFQIVTGCNMSGKSSYIRSTALMTIMAQLGSFVPASYASFPVSHSLFARVSTDDSANDATTSTFAAEMRETAFILRNIDRRSIVIVDELGRGTSTRDGLCIAIAVCEALIDSGALVWFVTHFRSLPRVLAERAGVVNLHLAVDMSSAEAVKMLYRVSDGPCEDTRYGLVLANVVGLPQQVLRVADYVSTRLAEDFQKSKQKKATRTTIALAQRRKLVLGLREQLIQARDGNMRGEMLARWLKELQDEFVTRMAEVEADLISAENVQEELGDVAHDESRREIQNILRGGPADEGDGDGDGTAHGSESHRVPTIVSQPLALPPRGVAAAVDDGRKLFNRVHRPVHDTRGAEDPTTPNSYSAKATTSIQGPLMRGTSATPLFHRQSSYHSSQKRSHASSSLENPFDEEVEGDEKDWWCIRTENRWGGHKQTRRSVGLGDTSGKRLRCGAEGEEEGEEGFKMSGALWVEGDADKG